MLIVSTKLLNNNFNSLALLLTVRLPNALRSLWTVATTPIFKCAP
jgi:hypothetical protein